MLDYSKMSKEELENLIIKFRNLYWNHHTSVITDYEYDELLKVLRKIDSNNKLLQGFETSIIENKVEHKDTFMFLNYNKIYKYEELCKWLNQISRNEKEEFIIEPKYDGVSCTVYNKGELLVSRGNGKIGENLTPKKSLIDFSLIDFKQFPNIPIQGELIVKLSSFKKLFRPFKKKGKIYKTPRHMVAGILNMKDISMVKEIFEKENVKIIFMPFHHISIIKTYKEILDDWVEIINKIIYNDYPLDGVIIKIKDTERFCNLGYSNKFIRGAVAFKFISINSPSRILNIEWKIVKQKLIPIAHIKPVELDGIIISKVNLFNRKYLETHDIKVGDLITVEYIGGAVPHIIESRPGKKRVDPFILKCPCCMSFLEKTSKDFICVNPNCFEVNLKKMYFACKKIGLGMITESILTQIMMFLNVQNIADILCLNKSDLESIPDFKKLYIFNISKALEHIQTNGLKDWEVLSILEIYNIDIPTCKKICKNIDINELFENRNIVNKLKSIIHNDEKIEFLIKGIRDYKYIYDKIKSTIKIHKEK